MTPGAILFWEDFKFADGGHANKLLVILGYPRNQCCIAVKTTSKQHKRDKDEGCHNDKGYFFVKGPSKMRFFEIDTWIITEEVYIIPCEEIKAALGVKRAHAKGNLSSQFVAELRNCLKNSQDISPEELAYLN